MPDNTCKKNICLACSIFKMELEKILAEGQLDLNVQYFNSMLHMEPEKLKIKLDEEVKRHQNSSNNILLLYGECHNHMDKYNNDNIKRVSGSNCIEILLGKKRFKELHKDGAFFFIYEWAKRWREIFENELDLKGQIAKDFMRDMHKYLLYIDTGFHDIPTDIMCEASEYLGLPWKTIKVDTAQLRNSILTVLESLSK